LLLFLLGRSVDLSSLVCFPFLLLFGLVSLFVLVFAQSVLVSRWLSFAMGYEVMRRIGGLRNYLMLD